MTYLEQLKIDRPDVTDDNIPGNFCIGEFGYKLCGPCKRMDAWLLARKACEECWKQEMEPGKDETFLGTISLSSPAAKNLLKILEEQDREWVERLMDGKETLTLIYGDKKVTLYPK